MELQGFPTIGQPFVDKNGFITQAWRQFLVGLWRLVGGGINNGTFVTGDIKASATLADQLGWLACDGAAVSRTTYATLFATIGVVWGIGDGVTTFNVPDLRKRTMMGQDGTAGYVIGNTGGAASVTLAVNQLPAHNHPVVDPGHVHAVTDPTHTHGVTDPGHSHGNGGSGAGLGGAAGAVSTPGATDSATTGVTVDAAATGVTVNSHTTGVTTGNTGGGVAVATLSPYAAVAFLIKT